MRQKKLAKILDTLTLQPEHRAELWNRERQRWKVIYISISSFIAGLILFFSIMFMMNMWHANDVKHGFGSPCKNGEVQLYTHRSQRFVCIPLKTLIENSTP